MNTNKNTDNEMMNTQVKKVDAMHPDMDIMREAGEIIRQGGLVGFPTELPGVDPAILDPRDTYADASEWEAKAKDLAERFVKNFAKYEGNEAGKALVSAGPQA